MERRRDAGESNRTSLTRGSGKDLPPSNSDWPAVEAGSTEEVDARALADHEASPCELEAAKRRLRHEEAGLRIVWLQ